MCLALTCTLSCGIGTAGPVPMDRDSLSSSPAGGHAAPAAESRVTQKRSSHAPAVSGFSEIPVQVVATTSTIQDQHHGRCLAGIKLRFSRSVALASMLGKVTLNSSFHHKRPFYIDSYNSSYDTFVLRSPAMDNCFDPQDHQEIFIAESISSVDGQKLSRSLVLPLASLQSSSDFSSDSPSGAWDTQADLYWQPFDGVYTSETDGNRSPTVTAGDINRAFGALRAWMGRERGSPLYLQDGVSPLPTNDGILQSYEPQFSLRQYGTGDTFYVLRRAAEFVKMLFPDQTSVRVVDVSDQDGHTPAVSVNGSQLLLHPKGAHEGGKDADVAYIEYASAAGQGADKPVSYDMEKNFWFLYMVLQSSSVDMVITAYKSEFVAMARTLYQRGLISDIAAGRFNVLMEDHELNHDKHMHISIGNANNNNISRKFQEADDVYNCYLALSPDLQGGVFNFCAEKS